MLDRTKRSIYTISKAGNGILTIDYNPEASEQYQFYSNCMSISPLAETDFSVYRTRMTLKQAHLQKITKEYIYSRNKNLMAAIAGLAEEYDKKPEGLPFYLVAPYLFFNQHKAISTVSNGHTAWVRYDHIKKTLKIKSYFSGKYYEVLTSEQLASLYETPIYSNILETSIHINKLFGETYNFKNGFTNFPVTYHIYKPK